MPTTMAQERATDSARKRAMTRSITGMVERAEECITGAGGLEIYSSRLPRGGWGTMMNRDPKTGQVDYSEQDEEAERVMARLLYRKLSRAVAEPGDVAYAIVINTDSERAPEYLVPKMVTTVRGWTLYPEEEGGFSTRRLAPGEVEKLSPRRLHVGQDLEEPPREENAEEEPEETFEEFMAEEMYNSFDEDARLLTREEKIAEWHAVQERRRRQEEELDGPQYMPEDEVRYL